MKVTALRFRTLALPFREPYHWAGRVDLGAVNILVEVETDAGVVGYGVSTAGRPAGAVLAALEGAAPSFVGASPFDVERLLWDARFLGSFNHAPRFANLALAGVESALWDVIGKTAGLPVYQLLGGACRDSVDYFSFPQGDSAEELAESAGRGVEAGHAVFYLKVGRGEARDVANTAAVREVIGDRRLRVDANEAWDPATAVRMIRRLSAFDLDWVEQPTPARSLSALRQVKEAAAAMGVPVAADQSVFTLQDVYEVCRLRAADVVVLSFHETGGLLALKKAAAVAEAAGISLCLHGQSAAGVSDLAQHHVGLAVPNLTDGNQIMFQLFEEDVLVEPGTALDGGGLGLPTGPGLGCEIDWAAVERAEERYHRDPHYHRG